MKTANIGKWALSHWIVKLIWSSSEAIWLHPLFKWATKEKRNDRGQRPKQGCLKLVLDLL